jgi:hypothetical protein
MVPVVVHKDAACVTDSQQQGLALIQASPVLVVAPNSKPCFWSIMAAVEQ